MLEQHLIGTGDTLARKLIAARRAGHGRTLLIIIKSTCPPATTPHSPHVQPEVVRTLLAGMNGLTCVRACVCARAFHRRVPERQNVRNYFISVFVCSCGNVVNSHRQTLHVRASPAREFSIHIK